VERRCWARRKGNPVPVSLNLTGVEPLEGWVMDRSPGGLGLRVDQQMHPGEALKIRSNRAHTAAWIDVEVCYCNPDGASYRVGVKVLRELSYLDIQQFG
jgi:hypothetical protein